MDSTDTRPLQTLAEFQQAHEALLDLYDAGTADDGQDHAVLVGMMGPLKVFLRRGAEGGAYLFEAKERRAAQGLLDYWASLCYSANLDIARPLLLPHDAALLPSLDGVACPYVGLEAFGERDAGHFFGREDRVEALVLRLQTERLVVVTGASGSGKSSLVLAGLLPALRADAVAGSAGWRYVSPLVPGGTPLEHLVQAVAGVLRPDADDSAAWQTDTVQRLRARPSYLAELFAADARPAVLLVDQFEEMMTLRTEANAADFAAFAAALESLLSPPAPAHRLLLTMRSDVDTQLAREYPELNRRYGAAAFPLASMDSKQLREAIEAPAAQAGLKFQDGVVDDLIRSVVGEDAGLPLLQFSLMALWERRHGNLVTLEALREVGSPRQAMTVAAARLHGELSREQQLATERLFLALSRQGEGATVFRNRATRRQLHEVSEANLAERVIEKFEQARLLRVTRRDPAEPLDDVVEVAHEALLRGWDLLQRLFAERRYELERRAFLRTQALKWREAGFDPAFLLSGLALKQALAEIERLSMNALEQDFVDKSTAAEQAAEQQRAAEAERRLQLLRDEARISRRLLWTSLAVVGVLLLTTTLAWLGWQRANRSAQELLAHAEQDSAKVLADRLAVEASTSVDTDADLSLFYASEAVKRDPSLLARVMPSVLESLRYRRAALRLPLERIGPVAVLALSPQGDRVLLVTDKLVSEWSSTDGAATAPLRRTVLPSAAGRVHYAVYVPGSGDIALATSAGVWLWPQTGEAGLRPLATQPPTRRLSVSDDGRVLAAVSDDQRQVWAWSLAEGRQMLAYSAADRARDLVWAGFPVGADQLVVVAEPDPDSPQPQAYVFDRRGGVFAAQPRAMRGARCSPPGMAYAVAGSRLGLLQWTNLCVQELTALGGLDSAPSTLVQDEVVDDIVFSGDGRQVVKLMRRSNEALVEGLDSGSVLRLQGAFDLPQDNSYEPLLSISANGERLAIKGNDGSVRLFDLGATSGNLALRSGVVWTSPDDKLIVTRISTPAGAVFDARDAATGKVLRRLAGGADANATRLADLEGFVLDADGRHLHALARCGPPPKAGDAAPRCIVSHDLSAPDVAPHEKLLARRPYSVGTLYVLSDGDERQVYSAAEQRVVWPLAPTANRRTMPPNDPRQPRIELGHERLFAVRQVLADRLTVRVYAVDAGGAKLVREIERPAQQGDEVVFLGRGRALLLSSERRIELWDTQSASDAPALVIEGRAISEISIAARSGVVALRSNSRAPWELFDLAGGRPRGELPADFRIEPGADHGWARVEGGWEVRALAEPTKVLLAGLGTPDEVQFDRAGEVAAVRLPREDRLRVYRIPNREPTLEGRLGNLRGSRLTAGGHFLDAGGVLVPVDGAELLRLASQPVQSRISAADRCRLVRDKQACAGLSAAAKP